MEINFKIINLLVEKKIIRFILNGTWYNNSMAILNNLDNEQPLFETESTSLAIKVFSETCCNGCSCKSESDHKPE